MKMYIGARTNKKMCLGTVKKVPSGPDGQGQVLQHRDHPQERSVAVTTLLNCPRRAAEGRQGLCIDQEAHDGDGNQQLAPHSSACQCQRWGDNILPNPSEEHGQSHIHEVHLVGKKVRVVGRYVAQRPIDQRNDYRRHHLVDQARDEGRCQARARSPNRRSGR